MIVEPVGPPGRSRLRRFTSALTLAVPALILGAVLVGGLLGRAGQEDPVEGDRAGAADPTQTVSLPTPGGPRASPGVPDVVARAAERASFPASIDGLPVRDVGATVRRQDGGIGSGIQAVMGYLSLGEIPPACVDEILGPAGALCWRHGLLLDELESPWAADAAPRIAAAPVLRPQFPPGVRLPAEVAGTIAKGDGPPLPVVLLGRFEGPVSGVCLGAGCPAAFIVRGVAWYDGHVWRRPTVLQPTLDFDIVDDPWPERRAAARDALGDVERVLVIALVSPLRLATIDRVAAGALPRPASERVWYVLGLEVTPTTDPNEPIGTTRWVVVDDATGELLASGGDEAEG